MAEVVFNQCTTSNANSQTGITQQHPNFEVQFDYRLLDDIELAKKLYHEKEKGDSDASDEESDRKSIDTLDSEMSVAQENHLSTLLATHSHVSKHHPLIIMVSIFGYISVFMDWCLLQLNLMCCILPNVIFSTYIPLP